MQKYVFSIASTKTWVLSRNEQIGFVRKQIAGSKLFSQSGEISGLYPHINNEGFIFSLFAIMSLTIFLVLNISVISLVNWSLSVDDACNKLDIWRKDYNQFRPHSSLWKLTPKDYADQLVSEGLLAPT